MCLVNNIKASHIMGADLQYVCLGNNQYQVTLHVFRDCCGIAAGSSVQIELYNGCTNTSVNSFTINQVGSVTEVSELCPSQLSQSSCNAANPCSIQGTPNQGVFPGVQMYIYQGVITLPSQCSQWYFRWSDCCRNAAINNLVNPSSDGIGVRALVNNTNDPVTGQPYCDSSILFTRLPVPFVCTNSDFTFNNGGVVPQGDSIAFSLIQPLDGYSYNPLTFSSGWSTNAPVRSTTGFLFDPATGQIEFNCPYTEFDVMALEARQYKNGVLIGSTMRDIQIGIFPCTVTVPTQDPVSNVQNGNQIDSVTLQVCPGTPLTFDVVSRDPGNHNLTLTSNVGYVLAGSTMTQIGSVDSAIARIRWTPQPGDTGCHSFILTTINDDCPINGSVTRVYTLCVFNKVQLLAADSSFCGNPVQLRATGGANFQWTPTAGLNNPTSFTPLASPTVPTMYHFTSDCGTDSVFINVYAPFTSSVNPNATICQNGQYQLIATTDNLYAPYQFHWVPTSNLFDPFSGNPNDTINDPIARPTQTTTYKCYISGVNGCTNIDSVTVNVAGAAPNIIATAQPTVVCPGDRVDLSVVATPRSCGISNIPCSGHFVQCQIGNGTTYTPNNSPTQYPTVYGHNSQGTRHQFLYLQSEILPLVGNGGKIDSIAFFAKTVRANDTLRNFEIKIGCTQSTSLTGWEQGLSTVFTPKDVAMLPTSGSTGWITHALDFPYDWDGTSNLVIEICAYTPGSGVVLNNQMRMTPTAFNSVYFAKGNIGICNFTGNNPTTSTNRPDLLMNMCVTDVTNFPITWTPSTGPNAPSPTNTANTVAHPQNPTTYNVDIVTTAGCHSSNFVFVNVDTTVRLTASPLDTFLCNATSIQLTANASGNPLPGQSFSYAWTNLSNNTSAGSGSTITVNPSVSTDYLVTLTGGACTLRDTLHVRLGTSIPVNLRIDSISCHGMADGKIVAIPTGGTPPIHYTWSNGPTIIDSITNLGPQIYSVTISDAQQCTGTATATLIDPAVLSFTGTAHDVFCFGANNGTITLNVTGGTAGYTYSWNPAQQNSGSLTGLSAGNYSVTVTDAHSCTATAAPFVINEPPALTLSVTPTNASCATSNNGQGVSNAGGGTPPYSYSWDGTSGASAINTLGTGNHTLVVTDASGCTISSAFNIDTMYVLHVTATATDASCFGAADGTGNVTTLNGTPAYQYLWTPGGQNVANPTGLTAANYTVVVTDNVQCTASATAAVNQPPQIILSFTHIDPTCSGNSNGSVTVSATGGAGGFTYSWQGAGNGISLSNIPAGTYTVTVTDASNCSVQGSETLTNPPSLLATFINVHQISCANAQDGSVEVQVSGGTPPITFAWSNQVTQAVNSNLAPAVYTVTVADNNQCDTILSITFTAPPLIAISNLIVDSVSCPAYTDGEIQITGTGGTPGSPDAYEYSIDGTSFQSSQDFSGLKSGIYHIYIRDGQGCLKDTIVTVGEPAVPVLTIMPQDSTIELGKSITLVSDIAPYSGSSINFYTWSPISGISCADCANTVATPYTASTFTLTVNYLGNCTISQTVKVIVANGEDFFVPGAFSPNGDGNNDVFMIYGATLAKAKLVVYNRWGEKVFDNGGNQWTGWDGYYKGVLQNPGVYTYVVEATYLNGKTKEKKGSITLVR